MGSKLWQQQETELYSQAATDHVFSTKIGFQTLLSFGVLHDALPVISFGPLCNGKECDPLLLKPMMDSFWNLTYDEQAGRVLGDDKWIHCLKF